MKTLHLGFYTFVTTFEKTNAFRWFLKFSEKIGDVIILAFHDFNFSHNIIIRKYNKILLITIPRLLSSYFLIDMIGYILVLPIYFIFSIIICLIYNIQVIFSTDIVASAFVGSFIKVFKKCKFLIYYAGDPIEIINIRLKNQLVYKVMSNILENIIKYNLSRANVILTVNKKFALKAKSYGAKLVRIVYVFVDTNLFKPVRKTNRKSDNIFRIITVARLVDEKGLNYLIKSIKILYDEYNLRQLKKKVILTIAGDGPLRTFLQKLIIKLNLSNVVNILGWIDYEKLPSLYNDSSLFILPSLSEGTPLALLEAMACKLPVIVTNIDSFKEIIKDNYNGLIVPTKDSEKLAEKIFLLLTNDDLRMRLGERAYITFLKKYSNFFEKIHNIIIGTC